nr:hypothetical protein [uncultured Methanoregula sp.]
MAGSNFDRAGAKKVDFVVQMDPDGNDVISAKEIELIAQILTNGLTEPIGAGVTNILTAWPFPANVNGSDYVEKSVTSASGTTTDTLTTNFLWLQTRASRLLGTARLYVSHDIELSSVDASYAGTAQITTIVAILYRYKIADGTKTLIQTKTKTVNKAITGTAASIQTFSEIFAFDLGLTPRVFGSSSGELLYVEFTTTVQSVKHASASTSTIAKARLNCTRGSEDTIIVVPVV